MSIENMRYIQDTKRSGALNMGLDEALLESVIAGSSLPVLRLYGWQKPTLTIGYFQGIEQETDLVAAEHMQVDVLRRSTGGGAVLHEFELTYSLVAPVGFGGIPAGILDSYRCICAGVIEGLKLFGVAGEFVPLNDIIAGGRKISGNAQTRRAGVILQHGTILLKVDVDKMFGVLKVPNEKIRDKMISDVRQRVVGLGEILGREVGLDEAQEKFALGFARALNIRLLPDELVPRELVRAQALVQSKYGNREWNYKR